MIYLYPILMHVMVTACLLLLLTGDAAAGEQPDVYTNA